MTKASGFSTDPKFKNIRFESYRPGKDSPFVLDLGVDGRGGQQTIGLDREAAVTMALQIITAAAALDGLTDKEREKLRSIADIESIIASAA